MPALILALSLIQVLLLAGLTVAREREDGTFDMMLMTPANSMEILIGKAVIPTVIACLQAFLIFLVGVIWFELPFAGSAFALGVLIFGFALSFVGLGLAISAAANTCRPLTPKMGSTAMVNMMIPKPPIHCVILRQNSIP